MRKMQKIAALGLAGTMALSLAACGGSGDSTADTASTAESTASSTEATAESTGSGDEAVTLNWALWDKDSTAYWQALADGYMESHPNVTIEMTDLGSTDYMTQLATQLAGGNGELDVLSIKDIPGYSNLINLGMLEPLSGKLTTDESKFNGVLEQLTAEDGNYYAVPFRSDFWVVYYNKDIFDQAGVEYPTNDMTMADFDAKIREVKKIAQDPISLETPIGEKEDSHLGDFIEDHEAIAPDDAAGSILLREQIEELLTGLTERERQVLELRFGLKDGKTRTLEEVGKYFDVTRERIRQIEGKALSKLKKTAKNLINQ